MEYTTQVQDLKKTTRLKSIESLWQGFCSYKDGISIQDKLIQKVVNGRQHWLLGLEHPSTITLGVRGDINSDLLQSQSLLQQQGFQIERSPRGGQATFHNPGQLVIYPICDLRDLGLQVREWVNFLQQITVQVFAQLGVKAHATCVEPGIFTDKGKLAAFGIKVSQGISRHGLAINVSNDLAMAQVIRNCGVSEMKVTNLVAHCIKIELSELFGLWSKTFVRAISLR